MYDENAEVSYRQIVDENPPEPRLTLTKRAKSACRHLSLLGVVRELMPFPWILAKCYKRAYILSDLIAGLTMAIFNVPQGMAYGLLSSLSPINGLYTSFYCPLVYMFFGTSRHLAVGTFAVTTIMFSEAIIPAVESYTNAKNLTDTVSPESMEQIKLNIGIMFTVMVGLIQFVFGALRLGFLVSYMPSPMVQGFTCACSAYVVLSQLDAILGITSARSSGPGQLIKKIVAIVTVIKSTNLITLALSICCLLILIGTKEVLIPRIKCKRKVPVPIELILLIVTCAISYFAKLNELHEVSIIGHIPSGLPKPVLPQWHEFFTWALFFDAVQLAFLSYAISASISKVYAAQFKYEIDYNQEWVAIGLVNAISGPFGCMVASGALARSAVVVEVGMKTQISSLVNSFFMLLVLFVLSPVLAPVPKCVLACAIVVALKNNMLQILRLPQLFRACPIDGVIWLVSFLSTLFLNIPMGLFCSIGFALLTIIVRSNSSQCQLMGRVRGSSTVYLPMKKYANSVEETPDDIKVLATTGPVFFPNVTNFKKSFVQCVGLNPIHELELRRHQQKHVTNGFTMPVKQQYEKEEETPLKMLPKDVPDMVVYLSSPGIRPIKGIVLDCQHWNVLDSASIKTLKELVQMYTEIDVPVYLASFDPRYFDQLHKADLSSRLFLTINLAVEHLQKQPTGPDKLEI